jgi:glutamate synthase (NADPH) small chain
MSNAHRELAASVTQLDNYPAPAGGRPRELAGWPRTPKRLPTSYALDEGGERRSGVAVVALHADGDGRVGSVEAVETDPQTRQPLYATRFTLPADLVLVAIGFTGPEPALLDALGLARDGRGNVRAEGYATSAPGVFCAGDARIGQSLTVTAIDEGRKCARMVDRYLEASG